MSEDNVKSVEKQSRCAFCKYCSTAAHAQTYGDDHESVSARLKRRWKESKTRLSLKQFVKDLVKSGDAMAQKWLDNKSGLLNQSRSDKNGTRVRLEANASKMARKKTKVAAKKEDSTTPAK